MRRLSENNMKKIIIPILIILLFVLFTSCTNSVSDAVKKNEERLVGFMDTYRAVKGYFNSSVLQNAEGAWDLSKYETEKNVYELVEYIIYATGDELDKITSAAGTFTNKTEKDDSNGTKYTYTFNGVVIKYTLKESGEEKTLTIDGVLSTRREDKTTSAESPTTYTYYTYDDLIYFKQNEEVYKRMSAVISTVNSSSGLYYTLISASYDRHGVNCDILNKSNFLKK